MKTSDVDLDLIAYIALNDVLKNDPSVNKEDLSSKMAIHARKIKDNPSNIVIRI